MITRETLEKLSENAFNIKQCEDRLELLRRHSNEIPMVESDLFCYRKIQSELNQQAAIEASFKD
jgi:hypothetical protein